MADQTASRLVRSASSASTTSASASRPRRQNSSDPFDDSVGAVSGLSVGRYEPGTASANARPATASNNNHSTNNNSNNNFNVKPNSNTDYNPYAAQNIPVQNIPYAAIQNNPYAAPNNNYGYPSNSYAPNFNNTPNNAVVNPYGGSGVPAPAPVPVPVPIAMPQFQPQFQQPLPQQQQQFQNQSQNQSQLSRAPSISTGSQGARRPPTASTAQLPNNGSTNSNPNLNPDLYVGVNATGSSINSNFNSAASNIANPYIQPQPAASDPFNNPYTTPYTPPEQNRSQLRTQPDPNSQYNNQYVQQQQQQQSYPDQQLSPFSNPNISNNAYSAYNAYPQQQQQPYMDGQQYMMNQQQQQYGYNPQQQFQQQQQQSQKSLPPWNEEYGQGGDLASNAPLRSALQNEYEMGPVSGYNEKGGLGGSQKDGFFAFLPAPMQRFAEKMGRCCCPVNKKHRIICWSVVVVVVVLLSVLGYLYIPRYLKENGFPQIKVYAINFTNFGSTNSPYSFSVANASDPDYNTLRFQMNLSMNLGTYNPNAYDFKVSSIALTANMIVNTSVVDNPLLTTPLKSYSSLLNLIPIPTDTPASYQASTAAQVGTASYGSIVFPGKNTVNYTMLFLLDYSPDPVVGLLQDPTINEIASACGITARTNTQRTMDIKYNAKSVIDVLKELGFNPTISGDIHINCPFSEAQITAVVKDVEGGATILSAIETVFGGGAGSVAAPTITVTDGGSGSSGSSSGSSGSSSGSSSISSSSSSSGKSGSSGSSSNSTVSAGEIATGGIDSSTSTQTVSGTETITGTITGVTDGLPTATVATTDAAVGATATTTAGNAAGGAGAGFPRN
ncbi:hypothetical protein HK100_009848 [Physocladia obscura]|uniref:Uncharacterized protein n=1 Tax=Physocladia obscura TaxID=109957 RepID=A0AAD5T2X1_9FUNG|nr:hypothetical protein HK100_009848 [Physocladia obscura]